MFDGDLGAALRASGLAHRERPALWANGKRFTYRQLFDDAARMAAALRAAGVKPGDRVAILSHRTETAYGGIIAALLAGCTYTPLNTKFPAERNGKILRASGAAALILETACALRLDEFLGAIPAGVRVLTPEAGAPEVASDAGQTFAEDMPQATLEDLAFADAIARDRPAYLLFTSGTTGEPKGVPISHANVDTYLTGVQEIAQITQDDRLMQLVELTFDLSVHDMFLAWLNGAELYSLAENQGMLAPRLVAQHAITSCLLVPATIARSIQQGLVRPGRLPSLRVSFFCGEALPYSVARGWAEGAVNSRVINLYGPTEATVAFSAYEFDAARARDFAVLPIGWPLQEQAMGLFDADLNPAPQGDFGEIFLSGSQLTKGYWNAPHLDAEKFAVIDGARWYRTGDVGRWSDEHGYIFAGRADRQVKIRGYRVELQEIEGVVRRVSGRQEVAVIPWPPQPEGSFDCTVAFICGEPMDPQALISGCRDIVADYMSPEHVLFIESLPVNSNGKVDYKVLTGHSGLADLQRGLSGGGGRSGTPAESR